MVQRLLSLQLCFIHQRPCYPNEPDWMDGRVHGLSGFFWSSCTLPTWEFPFFRIFFPRVCGVFSFHWLLRSSRKGRDQAPETSFEIAKHFVSEFNLHNTNFIPNPEFFEPFLFSPRFLLLEIRLPAYHVTKNPHFRRWWNLSTFNLDPRFMACCSTFTLEKTSSIWVPYLPFFWGGWGGRWGFCLVSACKSPPKESPFGGVRGDSHEKHPFLGTLFKEDGQGPSGGWERLDPKENLWLHSLFRVGYSGVGKQ